MTRHKENGMVTRMRNTERAVRRNAVNPRPSESAETDKKYTYLVFYRHLSH